MASSKTNMHLGVIAEDGCHPNMNVFFTKPSVLDLLVNSQVGFERPEHAQPGLGVVGAGEDGYGGHERLNDARDVPGVARVRQQGIQQE